MAKTPDRVISEIVKSIDAAGGPAWTIEDKAALVTAVHLALLPADVEVPEANQAGKDKA